ncbi:hypothetical protein M0802_014116 [Mischocyttarus mexicanus]|nr:hypothetical protein M0802_014116 [Mischocyttarus mexicanus]
MSGVSAGRLSMQTASGVRLSRRTHPGELETNTATQTQTQTQNSTQQLQAAPAESVSTALMPLTTKVGELRQRMQWSNEMIEHVMRCFFTATQLETIRSRYRPQQLQMFKQKYPDINVTEQLLIDQKRTIISNNRIPKARIQNIKEEIAKQLNNTQRRRTQTSQEPTRQLSPMNTQNTNTDHTTTPPHIPTNKNTQAQTERDQIIQQLEEQYTHWNTVEPKARPRLPKLRLNKKITETIEIINQNTPNLLNNNTPTLQQIHTIIYSAASTIQKMNKQQPTINNNRENRKPEWLIRIENKINILRNEAGRITQYIKGNRSKKLQKKIIITQITHNANLDPKIYLDTIKQKIAVYNTRLRRYKDAAERSRQNSIFYTNQKNKFYTQLGQTEHTQIIPPTKEEITNYWNNIWYNEITQKNQATLIKEEEQKYTHLDNIQIIYS